MERVPFVEEYVRGISDEDLGFLYSRYNQRLGGDLGDMTDFLSRTSKKIDRWLMSAGDTNEWFNMFDTVGRYVIEEHKRRSTKN